MEFDSFEREIVSDDLGIDEESIEKLKEFVNDLEKEIMKWRVKKEQQNESTLSEEELCPICFSAPLDTTFVPCGHKSCNRCISLHLLNKKTCFFCNSPIDSITTSSTAQ